jgi:iron complex transport system substrate-binding protein
VDASERAAEWDDPLISGIGWVSELIEIAGGLDIYADRSNQDASKHRVVIAEEVIARAPELIIGSWCGKKFRPERVAARPGFDRMPAAATPGRVPDQVVADLAARTRRH